MYDRPESPDPHPRDPTRCPDRMRTRAAGDSFRSTPLRRVEKAPRRRGPSMICARIIVIGKWCCISGCCWKRGGRPLNLIPRSSSSSLATMATMPAHILSRLLARLTHARCPLGGVPLAPDAKVALMAFELGDGLVGVGPASAGHGGQWGEREEEGVERFQLEVVSCDTGSLVVGEWNRTDLKTLETRAGSRKGVEKSD